MNKWDRVRKYLKEVKKDCKQLRIKNDLSNEGYGMMIQIKSIEKILCEKI